MFFYEFNNLDNFINLNLTKKLSEEKKRVENIISLYNDKKESLSSILNNIVSVNTTLSESDSKDFINNISLLKNAFETLENINNYCNVLKETLNSIFSLCQKKEETKGSEDCELIDSEIKANLVEYNKQDEKLQYQILSYEKNTTLVLKIVLPATISIISNYFSSSTSKNNFFSKEIIGDNNILLISEKEQKAFLPYKYADIKRQYENSKDLYSSLDDVVEKLYVLPLNRFKNSSFSRFREAYYLIRNKENGSISKALDLGLELMFNYDLNPIIISACKNLDELDIYLDCLQENELSDFDCFEIKFEVSPKT